MSVNSKKEISQNKGKQKIKVIRFADYVIFSLLLCLLLLIIFSSSRANIQSDSVDYYAILQRLTKSSDTPIARNLHFVEQRSPGYPIISLLPYHFISIAIGPFVITEKIVESSNREKLIPLEGSESEKMLFPDKPLLSKDIFFKNFYIEKEGSWFKWKTILALLLASYILLFSGIIFSIKTLTLGNEEITGVSLIMLTIFTSGVFMHNIVNTPVYATLVAFGMSSIFCYFFIRSFVQQDSLSQFLAGLFLGILVLTRLEAVIILGILFLFLLLTKERAYLKNFILGSFLSLLTLLLYNFSQFSTPFHFGILKGDINQFGFDFGYIYANTLNPKSGMIFGSPLISLGIVGLFFSNKRYLKALGVSSFILIGLLLVRVPVMYKYMGNGPIDIGGLLVTCPKSIEEALVLIRYDINRYIIILAPFAVLGIHSLFVIIGKHCSKKL